MTTDEIETLAVSVFRLMFGDDRGLPFLEQLADEWRTRDDDFRIVANSIDKMIAGEYDGIA